jgi:4-hydroxy-tetrahydrodipicolinate synthase
MNSQREKARDRLQGVLLGLTTPFQSNGQFDEVGFRRNIEFYIKNGMKSFVVGGTYGEVTSLTFEERKKVIRAAVEQSAGRASILADTHHIGSLEEVVSLTKFAEEVKADFAYILTPFYWKLTDKALFEFYKSIAESVRIGIMLYTNPLRTNVRLKPNVVKELMQFDNIVAIKAADADITDVSDLLKLVGEKIVVTCGWEVHAIHSTVLGMQSYFGIVGNFNPDLEIKYQKAMLSLNQNELKKLHFALSELRRFFSEVDGPVVLKAAQDIVGLIGGPVRLPLWPMTSEQNIRLKAMVEKLKNLTF